VLLLLVLVATCMLIGDGCLTPSISVVASITGLKQISSIGNSTPTALIESQKVNVSMCQIKLILLPHVAHITSHKL
jgi:K+ transporter